MNRLTQKILGIGILVASILAGITHWSRKPAAKDSALHEQSPVPVEPQKPAESHPAAKAERALQPKSALSSPSAVPTEQGNSPAQDKNTLPAVVEYLKTQAYSSMSPMEINEILNLLTLGEGKAFEYNKNTFVTKLSNFEKDHPKSPLFAALDRLQGVYRSSFVDAVPRSDDQGYDVVLRFGKNTLTYEISLNSRVYYQQTFPDLKAQLMTGKNPDLPPGLFMELPARPDLGYIHPMYLAIMIGADLQSLIGILYNTNQFQQQANYVHAENLIFNKVE